MKLCFSAKIGMVLTFLSLAGTSAHAGLITDVSYTSNVYFFKWVFTWDGSYLPGDPKSIDKNPTNLDPWDNEVRIEDAHNDGLITDLTILSQHVKGPHALDTNPGSGFIFTVYDVGLLKIGTNVNLLDGLMKNQYILKHPHNPDDHWDSYKLSYSKGKDTTFTFSGVHVSEPSMQLLIIIGLICSLFLKFFGKKTKSVSSEWH